MAQPVINSGVHADMHREPSRSSSISDAASNRDDSPARVRALAASSHSRAQLPESMLRRHAILLRELLCTPRPHWKAGQRDDLDARETDSHTMPVSRRRCNRTRRRTRLNIFSDMRRPNTFVRRAASMTFSIAMRAPPSGRASYAFRIRSIFLSRFQSCRDCPSSRRRRAAADP